MNHVSFKFSGSHIRVEKKYKESVSDLSVGRFNLHSLLTPESTLATQDIPY